MMKNKTDTILCDLDGGLIQIGSLNANQGAEFSDCHLIARLQIDYWEPKSTGTFQLGRNKLFICDCNVERQCEPPVLNEESKI